jgi:CRISPR-associated protein Cas1
MMEEFRAPVVDSVVLNLVTNRKVTPENFTYSGGVGKACLIDDTTRSLLVQELEKKLNSSLKHPATAHNLDYRRCMEYQVHHLASVIQEKTANYQPLVLK